MSPSSIAKGTKVWHPPWIATTGRADFSSSLNFVFSTFLVANLGTAATQVKIEFM
jgi:hypothetical protein